MALARALRMASHLPPDVRAFMAATPPHRVLEKALHCHPLDQQQHVSASHRHALRRNALPAIACRSPADRRHVLPLRPMKRCPWPARMLVVSDPYALA